MDCFLSVTKISAKSIRESQSADISCRMAPVANSYLTSKSILGGIGASSQQGYISQASSTMALSAVAARRLAQAALQASSELAPEAGPSQLHTGIEYSGQKHGVTATRKAVSVAIDVSDETQDSDEPSQSETVPLENDDENSQGEAFDFLGYAASSGADTPTTSGRPRKKRRVDTASGEAASTTWSRFTPEENVNVCRLSAAQTQKLSPSLERSGGVVVSLAEDESLMLSGTCLITPLQGAVRVFLTVLSPSQDRPSHPLYAPLSHPLPCIERMESPEPALFDTEKAGITAALLQTKRSVFLLQELRSGIEGIDDGPLALQGIGRVWPEGKSAFGLEGCHPILAPPPRPVYAYQTPESWEQALSVLPGPQFLDVEDIDDETHEERLRPIVTLLKGPKRSGKSTLSREVVNRLLSSYARVAYLDCDLGQSEFGAGGTVGLYLLDSPLLGPAFTHPRDAVRAHFIGSLNPRLESEHYIACIADLLEHFRYNEQYPSQSSSSSRKIADIVPLVVNTQGWVKGLGAELLTEIERLADVTHNIAFAATEADEDALDLEQQQPRKLFDGEDYGLEDEPAMSYGAVLSVTAATSSPLASRYSPADMRLLSILSAFQTTGEAAWNFDHSLAGCVPLEMQTSIIKEIYLTGDGSEHVSEEDAWLSLPGSIVGLISRSEADDAELAVYQPGRLLPSPTATELIALAFVRAVAPDNSAIQLVTSARPDSLARVTGLIRGELEMPLAGVVDWQQSIDEAGADEVPFVSSREDRGVGMGKKRWRRNIQRRGHGA